LMKQFMIQAASELTKLENKDKIWKLVVEIWITSFLNKGLRLAWRASLKVGK
jgi:hypothetical protein